MIPRCRSGRSGGRVTAPLAVAAATTGTSPATHPAAACNNRCHPPGADASGSLALVETAAPDIRPALSFGQRMHPLRANDDHLDHRGQLVDLLRVAFAREVDRAATDRKHQTGNG